MTTRRRKTAKTAPTTGLDPESTGAIARGIGNRAGFHDGEVDTMLGGISFDLVNGEKTKDDVLTTLRESAARAGLNPRLPDAFLAQCDIEGIGFIEKD